VALVFVAPSPADPPPTERRDGWGSARGLRTDWVVRPTPAGGVAQQIWPALFGEIGHDAWKRWPRVHAELEATWSDRFGADQVRHLRSGLDRVLGHPDLALGLRPYSGGWRASKPYLAHTEALLESPRPVLPHYPLVLHRGGWPDGS
jgi:hypothetical protein